MAKLTRKQLADLCKEIWEDEAAGKLEDAHGTAAQREAFRKILEEKAEAKAKATENAVDRSMER